MGTGIDQVANGNNWGYVSIVGGGLGVVGGLTMGSTVPELNTLFPAQVQLNRISGLSAEGQAAQDLVAEGNTILGSRVGAQTSDGLRVIDHLVQTPSGQIVAIEVKSGDAIRNAQQVFRDNLMGTEGAVLTGKNAPAGLSGQQIVIPTTVRRYP